MARRTTKNPPPDDFEELILDVDISEEMRGSFLEYAYSVIYSRAIPDARDGLKPVQRRILFQMNEMGLRPDRAHVKCGRVVGDVMGKLHPHGDGAIYDTLVRMAQPWAMRLPLVDGHGNFGSLDAGPAAYRYCIAGEIRVRLADGTSPRIDDLVDLDEAGQDDVDFDVLDKDGKPVRVTKVFNSGVHPTKVLRTADGYELRGSNNHPVLCLVPMMGVPMFQWLRLDEITPGTVVCVARNAWTTAVPTAHEWMLGVLAGAWATEGWASATRAGFNNTDTEFFGHVLAAYDALVGGRRCISSRTLRDGHRLFHEIDIHRVEGLVETPLEDFIGRKAADKHIPGYVWQGGPGVKRAFLMAAFEGDGSLVNDKRNTHRVQFHSYSRPLARGMQDMLLEFGVWSRMYQYGSEYRLVISGRHNVRAFAERVGFLTAKQRQLMTMLDSVTRTARSPSGDHVPFVRDYVLSALPSSHGSGRKWFNKQNFDRLERWNADRSLILSKLQDDETLRTILPIMDSGYRFVEVAEITQAEPTTVYSLRVDSDDHSFLAGGFVNHNTECRMAEPATLLAQSLDENVVDMVPNYDGQFEQPEVLPAAFPNLLVNGASGIAVGMATNMPPHNLGEVIEAARHLLANPDATLDDLMRFVPGPDLPTGGRIIGLEGIREAYETGRGSFRTRATARVENITARRKGIVVTELPYMVGPERVRQRIAELVRSKKLQGVADVEDYTDRNTSLRLVVELKSGFVPEAVLEHLYRLTPLEESFAINNVALVDGQPRTLGLKELLQVFLNHRLDVVRRRSEFRRTKAADRLHLVDGLLIALLDIDEVIQLIRTSEDANDARNRLMRVFDLTETQARYILDTPLRRLTKYDRLELETEADELRRTIAELTEILESKDRMLDVVSRELADVAAAHATPRRTVLLESAGTPVAAQAAGTLEVTDDPCHVLLSSTGLLARTTSDEPLAASGKRAKHDVIMSQVRATARGHIGVVTSAGRVVRLPVLDLPALPPTAQAPTLSGGAPIKEFIELAKGERILCLTTFDPDSPGLALGTANGVVKRVNPDYPSNKDEWDVIRLDEGDQVVGATGLRTGEEDLVFVTSDAQLLRFSAGSVRPQGRTGGGVAGIRLGKGARVVFFGSVDPGTDSSVVTISGSSAALPGTQAGNVKVTRYAEYPAKGRATGGVRCHRFLKGEDTLQLAWAGPAPAVAAAGSGVPIALPDATGRRDGSGSPAPQPIAAVSGSPTPR
ncbi:MAG TPA: DNA gyrase subunit A [Jiangellales bacterium]|nr:DNA gyrase subunit A [Jiangellales bacterium]